MSRKNPKAPKGTEFTPEGYMPPSQLFAHRIKENTPIEKHMIDPKELRGYGHRRAMKKMVEAMRTYRLIVHKVSKPHLARTFVLSARYFLDKQKAPQKNRDSSVDKESNDVGQSFSIPAQIG